MRGRDRGHTRPNGFAELVAGDSPKLYAPLFRHRLGDVQVGREVLLIGEDRSTAMQTEGRIQGFVEIDGVLSPIATSDGCAPSRRPILSPTRLGASAQPA